MVIKTASAGVYLQEVDLTRGVVDPISSNVAMCAGPFQKGPVDQLIKVNTEVELREIFGKPTDENYEYWWTINNFLEYSGSCYVVRCDDSIGDVIDAGTPDGAGSHDQTMRNGTDSFVFSLDGRKFNTIDQSKTYSGIYIKNEDEFVAEGQVVANGGKFFGRNPGKWVNGLGIAVIDSGADFRLRLSDMSNPISTDYLLIVNGGASDSNFSNELYGGSAGSALTDPLNFEEPVDRKTFDDDIVPGARMVQYAKLSLEESINFSEVAEITLIEDGAGMECPADKQCTTEGIDKEVIPEVATTTTGDGTGLLLDLVIQAGVVVEARLALRGASKPTGYKEGDIVTTVTGADVEAKFRIAKVRTLPGTTVRIGDGINGIIGVVVREENGVITLANAVHKDGTFGDAAPGDNVSDPQIGGNVLGVIKEYAVLGYYTFYNKDRDKNIDVIWEPKEYTREEGMEWLWPNRPFGGETVYNSKVAKNVNGVPIQGEGSTATNPTYITLEGPASLTPSTGDTIVWNPIKERWVQNYTPKQYDVVFDTYVQPENQDVVVYPYFVLDAFDWYSQQVAFEGIPWIQFAPRPGTSAHAQELGCENDELNIIVYDALGDYETVGGEAPRRGRVVEQYLQASKLKGALTVEGSNNFYKDLINRDSQIIFSNEPLNIIDSNRELNPNENINTLNDGRVDPDTTISYGLKCAYLQNRYGTPNYENPNAMSSLISTSGVYKLEIVDGGAGMGQTENKYDQPTTAFPVGGAGLRVDYTTDLNGTVIDVKPTDGFYGTNYNYGDIITVIDEESGNSATFKVKKLAPNPRSPYVLLGGTDQLTASLGEIQAAYQKVLLENLADLDYILQGPAYDSMFTNELGLTDTRESSAEYQQKVSYAVSKANYIISIAEELKTCMAFVSPPRNAALDPIDSNTISENILEWANRITSSSYGVMDSGYKYMYDRFRDKFMFVPMNADVGGTMTRKSLVSQPFFSPAGLVRGQIKNVVKLGFDPSKANRDLLYSARVNPIVSFPGEGTVLYGDKTCLAYSSAFTRINVRRLFIYLEKAISKFAREVLFEFNDVPTRLNFVNTVNPFLTDIVAKRGVIDFLVVCDTSNNTPEVIDRNEFVADIYIKPNRSINFVQLTFVATKTGVSFGEAIAVNRRTNLTN